MTPTPEAGPARDPLFDRLAEAWSTHDPAPESLAERMVSVVRAELEADPFDMEYELLVLTSTSDQLVGTRATLTGPVTLQFDADELQLLVRVRQLSDTECRIDGWVTPASELAVTAIQGDRRTEALVTAPGRFEFTSLGREPTRLILSTTSAEADSTRFGTAAFDL
ncbi:hypothetical protein [Nocardioides sp.]|uniref:hypothetical protein n=1 Tax=Nocardioides sp. TaxID=35761 RepID=UPI002ED5CF10